MVASRDLGSSGLSHLDEKPSRRRIVLTGLSAAAVGALLGSRGVAHAQTRNFAGRKVVFVSWGGAFQEFSKRGYCDPFAAKTGATVVQDGPTNYPKLRVMVENKNPTWDVVDVTIEFLYSAAQEGLFEKIDTSVVDVKALDPKFVHEYGVANIVWSYNIAYSTTAFKDGSHPKSWADFFDTKRFPGRRALRNRVNPMLELALLADGVPVDRLYPLDVDRAFKKLDTIKRDAVWWDTNSQSQQLMIDGEATVGILNNGRIYDAVQKGGKLGIEWNQHMQSVDFLVVPKGSKNVDLAMALIAQAMTPESQAIVANGMALAPTNPKAFDHIKPEVAPWLPTNPENAKHGFIINEDYWKGTFKQLSERWDAWRLS